ncbi:RidA family protein [Actinomadura rubrisoli]|uniref:RidA family protein n=2 Tax=Actinomadura rubrisoli TaxID=2530368 RepID=A0A4V6PF34_9ACTN|nr:RidA family protein [Actinomadura rubrisoli]
MHPYTPVRRAGDLLFVSGQLGVDDQGELPGDITAETHLAFANLRGQLEQHGAGLSDVVKVTVYLGDLADRAEFDPIYADYFREPRPARTCIEAGALPFGARVEFEAVAYLPG